MTVGRGGAALSKPDKLYSITPTLPSLELYLQELLKVTLIPFTYLTVFVLR